MEKKSLDQCGRESYIEKNGYELLINLGWWKFYGDKNTVELAKAKMAEYQQLEDEDEKERLSRELIMDYARCSVYGIRNKLDCEAIDYTSLVIVLEIGDGREFRLNDTWGRIDYRPVYKAEKSLVTRKREEVRDALIRNNIDLNDGERSHENLPGIVRWILTNDIEEEEEEVEETPEFQPKEIIRERIIERETKPELENIFRDFMAQAIVQVAVDDMVPRIKEKIIDEFGIEPQKHEIKIIGKDNEEERETDGVVHKQFDAIAHYVANNVPVMMYGGAGSGKGVLAKQVADALNLDFYAMNSVTDEFKIAGFIDANGVYHETEFYRAFSKGGVFFLDEIDASAPEVLVCLNMALSDGYYSFPHARIDASPDFRVIAAGNTLGTGADAMYTGRLQLDAASLNRFAVVNVDYDERIDYSVAQGDQELVDFIHQYRKAIKECGLPGVASYRNISQLKIASQAISLEEALSQCLVKEMNQDDVNTILGRDILDNNNRWTKALRMVQPMVG